MHPRRRFTENLRPLRSDSVVRFASKRLDHLRIAAGQQAGRPIAAKVSRSKESIGESGGDKVD